MELRDSYGDSKSSLSREWLSDPMGQFSGGAYSGALRGGPDDLEAELDDLRQHNYSPEVMKALDGVRFIAEHLKEEDEAANVSRTECPR